jgi:hypothetical protein
MEETIDMANEEVMPLNSYTRIYKNAILSEAAKKAS